MKRARCIFIYCMITNYTSVTITSDPIDLRIQARNLSDAGQHEEANKLYQTILVDCAHTFSLIFACGNDLYYQQNFALAEKFFTRAAELNPSCAQAHFNCGILNSNLNNIPRAISYFAAAVGCNPHYARAHLWLAKSYQTLQDTPHAIAHFTRVIELEQNNREAHLELARLLRSSEQHVPALEHFKITHELNPSDLVVTNEFAIASMNLGQTAQARALYQSILEATPQNLYALYNIGYSYVIDGDIDQAIACYEKVLEKNPSHEQAKFALGHAYLRKGDMATAWQKHAWFYQDTGRISPSFTQFMREHNFANKKILLRPEGGMGDTIQFIRYARELKKQGAYIIACVQKPLVPLMSRCSFLDKVVTTGQEAPAADAHITTMSLPAGFNATPETIPLEIPYINPDPTLLNRWQQYFAHDVHVKIGICWQADIFNDSSRQLVARRGIPLTLFYQLGDFQQVSFYSLQKKDGIEQIGNMPATFPLRLLPENFDTEAGPFMDTAAIMLSLDLIITVDTAIAHLAGALGRPVWLLLPYAVDWRWIAGRSDSPWYPSMRIFKQQKPFDWEGVMQEVYGALSEYLEKTEQQ